MAEERGLISQRFAEAVREHLAAAKRQVEPGDTPWPEADDVLWPAWLVGKLDDALAPWSESEEHSATVSIYQYGTNGWEDSGEDRTAWALPYHSGSTISAGRWVRIEYHPQSQRWYVTGAECE